MRPYLAVLCALAWVGTASAADTHANHQMAGAPAPCAGTTLACAIAATPTIAQDGSLYVAWAAGGQVSVARSTDHGKSFAPAVAVNATVARLDNGPDSRPAIAVDAKGNVFVAYAIFKDDKYNGQVVYARSIDGGAHFSIPTPITGNPESQRFSALAFDPAGHLFAAWIDKRARAAARKAGKDYTGGAIAYAWWDGAKDKFTDAKILREQSCECCRIGLAFAGPGKPVVVFRNIFDGGVRDHAVSVFADAGTPGPIERVSVDDWKIDACPHHGPTAVVSDDGALHVAWFTQGAVRKGLFYAHSTDGGRSFSAPVGFGNAARQSSRPRVLAIGGRLWLGWREFDGERTEIRLIASSDGGQSWSAPRTIAATSDASDQPVLIADGSHAYLSWLTRAEGYRLLPLEGES